MIDFIAEELRRLRPGARDLSPAGWHAGTRIDSDIGADSLELLSLGSTLTEALHLHESGIEDNLLVRRSIGEWMHIVSESLAVYSAALTFHTSGSTGVPKACRHTLADLLEETAELAILCGPDRRRILVAVPGHHIYGFLFAVLLPQALGLSTDAVIDVRNYCCAAA